MRRRSLPDRVEALGFTTQQRAEGVWVLSTAEGPAAAVLSYPTGRDLDRVAPGGELPIATLLREVTAAGAREVFAFFGAMRTRTSSDPYDAADGRSDASARPRRR